MAGVINPEIKDRFNKLRDIKPWRRQVRAVGWLGLMSMFALISGCRMPSNVSEARADSGVEPVSRVVDPDMYPGVIYEYNRIETALAMSTLPSPTPMPAATATPAPTEIPLPSTTTEPDPNPTPTEALIPPPTETSIPTQMPTPILSPTPVATETTSPTTVPEPTAIPTPTETWTPLPTVTSSPSAMPIPSLTPTPEVTATPVPTEIPTPSAPAEPDPIPTPTEALIPPPATKIPPAIPLPRLTPVPTATFEPAPTQTPTQLPEATSQPASPPSFRDFWLPQLFNQGPDQSMAEKIAAVSMAGAVPEPFEGGEVQLTPSQLGVWVAVNRQRGEIKGVEVAVFMHPDELVETDGESYIQLLFNNGYGNERWLYVVNYDDRVPELLDLGRIMLNIQAIYCQNPDTKCRYILMVPEIYKQILEGNLKDLKELEAMAEGR